MVHNMNFSVVKNERVNNVILVVGLNTPVTNYISNVETVQVANK